MFALTKAVRPLSLFRVARPAFISSNIKDLERQLSTNLNTEFEGEQLDSERESYITKFLKDNKWNMEAADNSTKIVLTKKEAGHDIKILYEAKLPEGQNEEEEEGAQKNEEGADNQNYTEFLVLVDKNKPHKMLLDVIAVDGEINLNGIVFSAEADKLADRKNMETYPYNGPSFETLDENLQAKISKYLAGLGINEELVHFVEESAIHHEAKLYKNFLNDFKNFVE